MGTLAEKLQVKSGQHLVVLGAPDGYAEKLSRELPGIELSFRMQGSTSAVLLFAATCAAVVEQVQAMIAAVGADGLLLIAYPKGGSKVKTDLHRDILAAAVEPAGWRGIRLVALDETWSAMRFRPAEKVGK